MIKIALLGLLTIFLTMMAGSIKREYAIVVTVGATILLAMYGVNSLKSIVERIMALEESVGVEQEYLTILLKMVGIAYLTQLVVSLCRDAGNGAVAGQINTVGKISMLIVSFPVLEALLKTVGEMLT